MAFKVSMMSMPVVVTYYPAIVVTENQVVDVSQVVAGDNTIFLPHFIANSPIPSFAGNHKRAVYDLCFSHGLLYHA